MRLGCARLQEEHADLRTWRCECLTSCIIDYRVMVAWICVFGIWNIPIMPHDCEVVALGKVLDFEAFADQAVRVLLIA